MAEKIKMGAEIFENPYYTQIDRFLTKRQQSVFFKLVGLSYYHLGDFKNAEKFLDLSLRILNTFRLTVSREDRRLSYLEGYSLAIDALIDSLYRLKEYDKCFACIEKYKSMVLFEALTSNPTQKFKRIIREKNIEQAEQEAIMSSHILSTEGLNKLKKRGITIVKNNYNNINFYYFHSSVAQENANVKSTPHKKNRAYITYFLTEDCLYSFLVYNKKIISHAKIKVERSTIVSLIHGLKANLSHTDSVYNGIVQKLFQITLGEHINI
ncbi:hypothetical protein [Maridesulfovibrio bastinii]|uniref:hypothetical protein n=1 Tax=Maridesulfovibrio bastinii TaxID=47157 RepID=UPI000482425F|nr:hypothetical protein [Maridesulfovibrio bastinii]